MPKKEIPFVSEHNIEEEALCAILHSDLHLSEQQVDAILTQAKRQHGFQMTRFRNTRNFYIRRLSTGNYDLGTLGVYETDNVPEQFLFDGTEKKKIIRNRLRLYPPDGTIRLTFVQLYANGAEQYSCKQNGRTYIRKQDEQNPGRVIWFEAPDGKEKKKQDMPLETGMTMQVMAYDLSVNFEEVLTGEASAGRFYAKKEDEMLVDACKKHRKDGPISNLHLVPLLAVDMAIAEKAKLAGYRVKNPSELRRDSTILHDEEYNKVIAVYIIRGQRVFLLERTVKHNLVSVSWKQYAFAAKASWARVLDVVGYKIA